MAALVWKIGLIIISAVVVGGLLIDLGFYLAGHPTISDFLRARPLWYWIPAALMIAELIVLGLHLFILKMW